MAFSEALKDRVRVLFASGLRWQDVQAKIKEETGETISRKVIYENSPKRTVAKLFTKDTAPLEIAKAQEQAATSTDYQEERELIAMAYEKAYALLQQAEDDPKCAVAALSAFRVGAEMQKLLDQKAAVSGEARTVSNSIDELLGEAERARG